MTIPMAAWWMGIVGVLVGILAWKLAYSLIRYKCKMRGKPLPHVMQEQFTLAKGVGAVFLGITWFLLPILIENPLYALFTGIVVSLGVVMTFIDAKIRIIPNELLLVMLLMSLVFHFLQADKQSMGSHFLGLLVAFTLLWLASLFGGRGKVGAGDVKLSGVIGFIVGFQYAIVAIFIMAMGAFLGGLIGIYFYKLNWHSKIPMAGYLMGGLVVAMVLSQGMGVKIFGF